MPRELVRQSGKSVKVKEIKENPLQRVVLLRHGAQLWAGGLSLPPGLAMEQLMEIGGELLIKTDELRWGWWDLLAYIQANHPEEFAQAEHMAEQIWGWSHSRILNGISFVHAFPPDARVIDGQVLRTMTAEVTAGLINSKDAKVRAAGKRLVKKAEAERWTRSDLREEKDEIEKRYAGEVIPPLPPKLLPEPEPTPGPGAASRSYLVVQFEVTVDTSLHDWVGTEVYALVEPAVRDALGDAATGVRLI